MIFRRIGLKNFKGYKDVNLQLKPLTILLGANSAGKSSFGHALVGLKLADRSNLRLPTLSRPPGVDNSVWPVDLGNIQTLRTDGEEGPVQINVDVETAAGVGGVDLGFGGANSPDLELSRIAIRFPPVSATSSVANIVTGDRAVPANVTTDGVVSITPGPPEARAPQQAFQRLSHADWQEEATQQKGKLLFAGWGGMSFAGYGTTYAEFDSEELRRLRFGLRAIRYLAPNRVYPWRTKRAESDPGDDVLADGSLAADVLRLKSKTTVDLMRPREIPKSIDEARTALRGEWATEAWPVEKWLDWWLSWLDVATHAQSTRTGDISDMKVRLGPSPSLRDLPDIGFGVSQAFPVLVQGLVLPPDGMLIVEHPEAQLHPRAQAALADFFCSIARSGRQALIESHSESLLHRLRLRVALEPDLADQIAVYFIDKSESGLCCEPQLVSLADSRAVRWPRGFLDEAVQEEMALRFARAARLTEPK